MSDRLLNAPDLVFSKIFRHADLPTQKNLYRAYKDEDSSGLAYVRSHKMEVHCWLCQINEFAEMFCKKGGVPYPPPTQDTFLAQEPSLLSEGFGILFKYAREDIDKQYFILRDLKNKADMLGADQIFYDFQRRIGQVFKARDEETLTAHMRSVHRPHRYFYPGFFDKITIEIGKFNK